MAQASSVKVRNVIFFGETGSGKSSVINMLPGEESATVSNSAAGVTVAFARYSKTIHGLTFDVFDTAGLNGSTYGPVPPSMAIQQLWQLVCKLEDGINLFVYILRASESCLTFTTQLDDLRSMLKWGCPIVVVVTGLENKKNMENWWTENESVFFRSGISFKDHACITSTLGRTLDNGQRVFEREYDTSKNKVADLIYNYRDTESWTIPETIRADLLNFDSQTSTQPESRESNARNIIVFGETGAGKSSVINMLDGGGSARVSDSAAGVTFPFAQYPKKIHGLTFTLFDTAGLNETTYGSVPPSKAIEQLYQLVHKLEDGVSLLIYVMRAPRLKSTTQKNYQLFYEAFCEGKVPIAIIITGLENEDDMEDWWIQNEYVFLRNGMSFDGHACITSTRGKILDNGRRVFEPKYNMSKVKVADLIYHHHNANPWTMSSKTWVNDMIVRVHVILAEVLGLDSKVALKDLRFCLQTFGGLSRAEAVQHANLVKSQIRRAQ